MPTEETLKQLLTEMVEQEALVAEELKVIDEQIASLEIKLTESRARLSRVATDRDKVLNMKQRYVDGLDVPVSANYSSTVTPVSTSNGERQIKVQSVKEVKSTGQFRAQKEEEPAAAPASAPTPVPVSAPTPAPVLMPPPQEELPIPEAPPLPQMETPPPVVEPEPEFISQPVQTTSMPVERDDSDSHSDQKDSGAHGRPSGISALLEGLRSRDNSPPRPESVQEAAPAPQPTLPVPEEPPTKVLPVAQDPPPVQEEEQPAAVVAPADDSSEATASSESAEEGDSDTVKSINDALRSLFR